MQVTKISPDYQFNPVNFMTGFFSPIRYSIKTRIDEGRGVQARINDREGAQARINDGLIA